MRLYRCILMVLLVLILPNIGQSLEPGYHDTTYGGYDLAVCFDRCYIEEENSFKNCIQTYNFQTHEHRIIPFGVTRSCRISEIFMLNTDPDIALCIERAPRITRDFDIYERLFIYDVSEEKMLDSLGWIDYFFATVVNGQKFYIRLNDTIKVVRLSNEFKISTIENMPSNEPFISFAHSIPHKGFYYQLFDDYIYYMYTFESDSMICIIDTRPDSIKWVSGNHLYGTAALMYEDSSYGVLTEKGIIRISKDKYIQTVDRMQKFVKYRYEFPELNLRLWREDSLSIFSYPDGSPFFVTDFIKWYIRPQLEEGVVHSVKSIIPDIPSWDFPRVGISCDRFQLEAFNLVTGERFPLPVKVLHTVEKSVVFRREEDKFFESKDTIEKKNIEKEKK